MKARRVRIYRLKKQIRYIIYMMLAFLVFTRLSYDWGLVKVINNMVDITKMMIYIGLYEIIKKQAKKLIKLF